MLDVKCKAIPLLEKITFTFAMAMNNAKYSKIG